MRKLLLALALLPSVASAQDRAVVVATCGTPPGPYTAGEPRPITMNTNGETCSVASGGGGAVTQSGTWVMELADENHNPVSWAAMSIGNAIASVAVSTSTVVYDGGSNADAREIILTPLDTNSAPVYCILFDGAATTSAYSVKLSATDGPFTGGKDGYIGEIRCIAGSGTQTVLVSVLE